MDICLHEVGKRGPIINLREDPGKEPRARSELENREVGKAAPREVLGDRVDDVPHERLANVKLLAEQLCFRLRSLRLLCILLGLLLFRHLILATGRRLRWCRHLRGRRLRCRHRCRRRRVRRRRVRKWRVRKQRIRRGRGEVLLEVRKVGSAAPASRRMLTCECALHPMQPHGPHARPRARHLPQRLPAARGEQAEGVEVPFSPRVAALVEEEKIEPVELGAAPEVHPLLVRSHRLQRTPQMLAHGPVGIAQRAHRLTERPEGPKGAGCLRGMVDSKEHHAGVELARAAVCGRGRAKGTGDVLGGPIVHTLVQHGAKADLQRTRQQLWACLREPLEKGLEKG